LAGKEVYPILQTRDGDILIGAVGGVSRFQDGHFTRIWSTDQFSYSQALWEDPGGQLWIGHIGNMTRLNKGKTQLVPGSPGTVYAIRPERLGNVWVGGNGGLVQFRDNKIIANFSMANGLPGNDVKEIYESRDGALWIATYGGLAHFKDGKFTSWTIKEGLASNSVRSIYEDADGTLWIGTYDGGLSRFRNGKFFNYTTANGLFNNGVFAILEDRRGNFWISCNKGIYRISRRELNEFAAGKVAQINSIVYGKSDGMRSTECNAGRQPSAIIAKDGKLWFPTQDGVAVIDPQGVSANSIAPPVAIESVAVDRNNVAFTGSLQISPS
jgi:ligand-binding sensor domain-containing protein